MHPHSHRLKLSVLLIVMVLPILFTACDIASPEMPKFTTTLNLPFERQELLMEELVEDDGILGIDGEGNLFVSVEGDTISVEMEQDLAVDVPAQEISVELGSFEIEAGEPVSREFELLELYPAAGELPPGLVPVPAFQFDLNPEPQDIQSIESAHLEEGVLSVALYNDLQVPLAGPELPELLSCELRNSATGELLQTVLFDEEIPAGGTGTALVDMAGKTLPDSVALRIWGGSPGHPGVEDVDVHRQIRLDAEFLDMTVDAAVAKVGAQSLSETRQVSIGDSLFIQEALIQGGQLELLLENGTPLRCTVELVFDEIFTAGGLPLSAETHLEPGAQGILNLDLTGASIQAPGEDPLSALQYRISVNSPGSGGGTVALSAGDSFQSQLFATEMQMAECTGIFPEKIFELDPVSQELNLPEELAGVSFSEATLTIDVFNETGVPGDLDILLEATKPDGSTTSLVHSAHIEAAEQGRPAMLTKIVLDESNSNIQELLSGVPDRVEMTASVRVGGPELPGTARPGQAARVLWSIEAPLKASIEATEIRKEPFQLDLEESTREKIEEHLETALLMAEIENGLPLDLEVYFLVGPDSATVHASPERMIGPFTVNAASVDGQGYASDPLLQLQELDLDHEDVLAMTAENSFMALLVNLPGSAGEEIALRSTDGLTLRGILQVEVNSTD